MGLGGLCRGLFIAADAPIWSLWSKADAVTVEGFLVTQSPIAGRCLYGARTLP
jgi:hypothetical protein